MEGGFSIEQLSSNLRQRTGPDLHRVCNNFAMTQCMTVYYV